uniref:hypothetical protein n=1 Tax=Thaumasiovibrio occultus TaxID=1891184 RepID=UPI000B3634CC|nr:hypothetical protein [Thaumasiovibrio occultus]
MIGVIVKTAREVEELDEDWIPSAFSASELSGAFEKVIGFVPTAEEFCYEEGDVLIYFTIDDLATPRAITFNCTMAGGQVEIVKSITSLLGAKIYDSEAGAFVSAEDV